MMIELIIIVGGLVSIAAMVFEYKIKKDKTEVKKLQLEKEILQLEITKQDNQLSILQADTKHMNNIIDNMIN